MDLNALRVFVTVAEKGSFTAAANTLSMPTSNVSRAVAQLEAHLNLQLIKRSTRHMTLTEPGNTLFAQAHPMLEALQQTEAALTAQQVSFKGPLRICIPNEIGPLLFGDIIASYALAHPEVEISCVTNLSGLELLQEDLDLAIIIHRGAMDNRDYVARELAHFPCVVVAAPSVIAAYGTPAQVRDFEQLPCITTVTALKGAAWQFIDEKGHFNTINVNGRYKVNSGEMAFKAAIAGIGFAILAEVACQSHIDSGKLIKIALPRTPAPLQLYAVYAQRRYLPAKARVLIDLLQQHLSKISQVPMHTG